MSDVRCHGYFGTSGHGHLASVLCSLTSDLRCLYSSTSRTAGEFILSSDAYFPDHRSCVSTSFMLKFAHSVIVRATQQLASLSR